MFLIGLIAYQATEHVTCPAGQMVSGMCANQRVQATLEIVIHIFAGIAAIAVVTVAAVTAPSHKTLVTWVTFFVGSWVAFLFGFLGQAYGQALTAIVAGLMAAIVIARLLRRRATAPVATAP